MAAILQLRRGDNSQTGSIHFEESELFYNQSKETLQIGYSSSAEDNGNLKTLALLDETNTGSLIISNDITASNLSLSGNASIAGNINLGGTIVLGDGSGSDQIIINAGLTGSLIPNVDDRDTLGTNDYRFKELHVVSASIDHITLPGSGILSSSNENFNGFSSSVDSRLIEVYSSASNHENRLDTIETTFSTSVDTRLDYLEGEFSTSVDFRLDSAELFTSSQETKNSTLASYTASVDSSLSQINSFTSSQETKNSTLASYTGSNDSNITELFATASNHEGRIAYLSGSFSQSVDFRLDELETLGSGSNQRLDSLEAFTSSQETKNSTLASYTGSVDTKWSTLGTYTGSNDTKNTDQDNRLSSLETASGSAILRLNILETASQDLYNDNVKLHLYTQSNDTKFSTLQAYTESINLDLSQIHSYTSSLKTAIETTGSNVIVLGDLTVRGTSTSIDSTQVNIGDNIIHLNGMEVSNGGLLITDPVGPSTISGSLLWNTANDYWIAGQWGSESKILVAGGDSVVTGSEQVRDLLPNGVVSGSQQIPALLPNGVVSGSDQVTSSLDGRYLEINGDSVVSGSSQIDLTQTTNYTSGIKDRLNAEGVVSGSTQITNGSGLLSSSVDTYNGFSSSVDLRIISLNSFTSSQETKNSTLASYTGSVDNKFNTIGLVTASLNSFTSSQETKNSTLASYTGSVDIAISNLNDTTSSLNSFSSSINTTIKTKLDIEGVISGSSQVTQSLDTRYEAIASSTHTLISSSNQVTQSLNSLYEVSGSVSNLVGMRATSGSLGSAAWYHVSNSIQDGNPQVVGNAGAVKSYIDYAMALAGAGDITEVLAGNGISGGALSGSATITLDTGSAHFNGGIKTKLNIEGVISGSTQILGGSGILSSSNETFTTFSQSIDGRVHSLELFSSSLDTSFVTQTELASATGALEISIATKLNTASFETYTGSVNNSIGLLNGFTSSQESKNSTLATWSGSVDTKFNTIQLVTASLNLFTSSQENKNSTLATWSGSVDNSLSGLNAVSHSHTNKANLDTINQNLSTTSNVEFNDIKSAGSASIGTNLTIYGNLQVWGTQSIINSENLTVSDNIIYLAPTGSGDYDLGIVGHYNDGSYAHAGIFSDASDGHAWKVFKGLTNEVSGAVDTSAPSFTLADFKAANITATSFNGVINATNGVLSGSLQAQLPNGVVSGSSQVVYTALSSIPAGIVSGSSQITPLLPNGVVSGSSQIVYTSLSSIPAGIVSGSSQIDGSQLGSNKTITIAGTSVTLGGSITLPTITGGSGIVSGSSQITKTLQNVTTAGATTSDAITITNATASTTKTTGALIVTGGVGVNGDINAGGDIVAYASSDKRLKDNIQPIENPLQKINQIGGYSFEWNVEKQNIYKGKDYGVIAQEIEEILPELVDTRDNGYKAVKYDKLVSLLIEGIKDLSKEIENLKSQINK